MRCAISTVLASSVGTTACLPQRTKSIQRPCCEAGRRAEADRGRSPGADSAVAATGWRWQSTSGAKGTDPTKKPDDSSLLRRFFETVEIDAGCAGRDMGQLAEEALQQLTTLPGGKVTVTVDIQAELSEGVAPDLQRVIDENRRTLRSRPHGFEVF